MDKLLKIRFLIFCVVGVMTFLGVAQYGFAANQSTATTEQSINRIVAIVNDDAITEDQLNTKVQLVTQQLKAEHQTLPPVKVLREQLLQEMIDEKLQLQIAKRTGIRASQAEINGALNRIAQQSNISLQTLYQSVEKQGWTISAFKQEIANEVIIQKLQGREVASRINISQQEVNDFIQNNSPNGKTTMPEYHLAVILIGLPPTPSTEQVAAAQNRASNIVAKLRAGADFKKLAAANSTGHSVLKDGDLGWQKSAALPAAYTAVLPTLKVGQVSDPIRTDDGVSIVKLLAKRQSIMSSATQQKEVEQLIFQRQFADGLAAFLSQLRAAAYIKIML